MPETIEIKDVICLPIPEGRDVSEEHLNELATRSVVAQYANRPAAIIVNSIEWLITSDPDEADRFQPAHDCAACIAGADQARAHLRNHPGRRIALGNLTYTEVWS